MDIMLFGCNGKMGQVVSRLAASYGSDRIIAGCDIDCMRKNDYPVFSSPWKCNIKPQIIIDFSNASGIEEILDYAVKNCIPAVIATTGFSSAQKGLIEEASVKIPLFLSSNMSLGINLLICLAEKASKVLEDNFDIEIVEKHHNQKIDAPSGTAMTIADAVNAALGNKLKYIYDRHSRREKRGKNELGIHSIRGGTIVGEHSVIFAGNDEVIEIRHTAMSRDILASGALKAATFLLTRSAGLYGMKDLVSMEEGGGRFA